jgi:hypothetical protein
MAKKLVKIALAELRLQTEVVQDAYNGTNKPVHLEPA